MKEPAMSLQVISRSGALAALLAVGALVPVSGQPQATPAKKAPVDRPEDEALLFTAPGFDRPGTPQTATGDGTGQVKIVIRDAATGKPTFCRINVVGPDGNFYQPAENYLSPYALTGQWPKPGSSGNRQLKAPYRYIGR